MSTNRLAHLLLDNMPSPSGPFSDQQAAALLFSYRRDPSNVPCPCCGPDTIEVLAFIEPDVDPNGIATVAEPVGNYAAALYCHACERAIGILAGAGGVK